MLIKYAPLPDKSDYEASQRCPVRKHLEIICFLHTVCSEEKTIAALRHFRAARQMDRYTEVSGNDFWENVDISFPHIHIKPFPFP